MQAKVLVNDVYSITGIGLVPVGTVTEGTLRLGMKCSVNGKIATVKSIEMNHSSLQSVDKGSNMGFNLRGVGKGDISKGMELVFSDSEPISSGSSIAPIKEEKKGFFQRIFER